MKQMGGGLPRMLALSLCTGAPGQPLAPSASGREKEGGGWRSFNAGSLAWCGVLACCPSVPIPNPCFVPLLVGENSLLCFKGHFD